jgi:hypothetical protein
MYLARNLTSQIGVLRSTDLDTRSLHHVRCHLSPDNDHPIAHNEVNEGQSECVRASGTLLRILGPAVDLACFGIMGKFKFRPCCDVNR